MKIRLERMHVLRVRLSRSDVRGLKLVLESAKRSRGSGSVGDLLAEVVPLAKLARKIRHVLRVAVVFREDQRIRHVLAARGRSR